MYQTAQYRAIPAGWFWMLGPEDRQRAYRAHLEAGDTHIPFNLAGSYLEPGTLWPLALTTGRDYSHDLPAWKALALEAIQAGLCIDFPLSGDGMNFDPVGGTFGFDWLMGNLARIVRAVQGLPGSDAPDGIDLTPWCLFRPGWDGVFYGWDGGAGAGPNVAAFGGLFRQILPLGHLAIEHTDGKIPIGGGTGDYQHGPMTAFDTILSEFKDGLPRSSDPDPDTNAGSSLWMVVDRLVRPWHRPADMPTGPRWDPTPTFYLEAGNPRGPYFYVAFEWDAYRWCRGRVSALEVQRGREYLRAMGCVYTG